MTLGRVELSGGGALMLAVLYYLDAGGVMGWALAACAVHELGHCAAIRLLGGRVLRLRLSWAGAALELSPRYPLSPGRLVLAALAGPAVNLLLAGLSALLARRGAGEGLYLFAGINLGLAAFNLLPAGWLDGGRALRGLLSCLGHCGAGEQAALLCSDVASAVLLGGGLVLLWQSGGNNFTLLICGLWMAAAARKEHLGQQL